MSAPKARHSHTVIWLQPRTTPKLPAKFKRDVLAYPGAKAAFKKITSGGFPEDMLWRSLWGLAYLENAARKQKSSWYALPGIPLQKLRRFPAQICRMAAEIEHIDAKIRSDPAYGVTAQFLPIFLAGAIPGAESELRVDGDVLRDVGKGVRSVPVALARDMLNRQADLSKLAELPKLMKFYADYIKVVSKLTAHHASKAPVILNGTIPIELTDAVKKLTGRTFTNEIAELLTAAYTAVGIKEIVDPRNLKSQHSRRLSRKK